MGTPSQSYGTSLAIWDHTVLPATYTSERAPPNPSQAITRRRVYSISLFTK